MIRFRDFAPTEKKPAWMGSAGEYESLNVVLQAANDWMDAQHIDVVNVETVVLPLYSRAGTPIAASDAPLVYVGLGNDWVGCLQCVRVWYRE